MAAKTSETAVVGDDDAHERELWREATTMVLYVTIVLLAELAVLPSRRGGTDEPLLSGRELLAIIWGTTMGLAIAHLFAFRLAVRAFGAGRARRADLHAAIAQLAGAAFVAVVASVPVLLLPDDIEHRSVHTVLALELGVIGYVVARIAGQRRLGAAVFGFTALLIGLVVVAVKVALDH